MAISWSISVLDDVLGVTLASYNQARTPTGTNHILRRVLVNTSETSFAIPTDIATPRECVIKNHGSSNHISVGFATAQQHFRVYAGQTRLIELVPTQTTLYLLAEGTPVDVTIYIAEQ